MRMFATPSEARLWNELRGGARGVRFVRQAVLGRFIVDFLAKEAHLVVELDGGYHARHRTADARRDAKLECAGYRVLRVTAGEVTSLLPAVVARIRAALAEKSQPLPSARSVLRARTDLGGVDARNARGGGGQLF
jgi:very-short-patch-repair endonuclease